MPTDPLSLIVTAFRAEALDVVSVELRDPHRKDLPAFTAGAHLEIMLPSRDGTDRGLIRHYSLCNDSAERDRYLVAVGRVVNSRGGSRAVHELVRVGTLLSVQRPRNNFPLTTDARRYRFIAGGIGITPILSMIHWCQSKGTDWSLLYCARNRLHTAFYEQLGEYGDRVRFHFDDESAGFPDLELELAAAREREHVYCCGPRALMLAVEAACSRRPAETVHFEWFSAKELPDSAVAPTDSSFKVVVRSTGQCLQVAPDKSILETLEDNGVAIPFSCREGLCRTCETPLWEGEADHRDHVLSDAERSEQKSLMVCVSRAKSRTLVLDL
jgi:tetrachlorobenzoquinone reductase